jgi:glycosidase
VAGVGERQNLLADALLLTLEGIPCLYYGTEAALEDPAGGTNREGETGRLTFVPRLTDTTGRGTTLRLRVRPS